MSEPDFFAEVGRDTDAGGTSTRRLHGSKVEGGIEMTPATASMPVSPGNVRRWATAGDLFWQASETCDRLEPAFYNFASVPNIGICLRKGPVQTDGLLELPDTASADVLAEFDLFWTLKPRFIERGFLHKRGFLLWGPPGSGKTASLMLMSQAIIRQGGIVCEVGDPEFAADGLKLVRKIEPDRPIVALIEDLDALIDEHGENLYLALLDGENQVDNICFVATTNYPSKIDKRFVDRPSRFDTIRYIGMPSAAARRVYLSHKEPGLTLTEMDVWVARSKGLSIAHLRELIILVKCIGLPFEAAIARLEKMRVVPNEEKSPDRPSFGITGGGHE